MHRRRHRLGTVSAVAGSVVAVVAGAIIATLRGHRRSQSTHLAEPVVPASATAPPDTEVGAFGVQPASAWVEGVEIHLPAPSVWPVVLGLGITLLAFGVVTNLLFSALGAFLLVWSLVGWIRELRHE